MKNLKIVYRLHALRRMFEREINADDVLSVLEQGETIENYPTDQPYPSRLMLGFVASRPIHVVVADTSDSKEAIVITVYEPDSKMWESDFKVRRIK